MLQESVAFNKSNRGTTQSLFPILASSHLGQAKPVGLDTYYGLYRIGEKSYK